MDSQRKECNRRYMNKGNESLFILQQSIHTWPSFLLSTLLSKHKIWWMVLQEKYPAQGGTALYYCHCEVTGIKSLLSLFLWKELIKLVFDRPSKPAVKLTVNLEFNLFDCQSKNCSSRIKSLHRTQLQLCGKLNTSPKLQAEGLQMGCSDPCYVSGPLGFIQP